MFMRLRELDRDPKNRLGTSFCSNGLIVGAEAQKIAVHISMLDQMVRSKFAPERGQLLETSWMKTVKS
jgi:hypothetical protein